MKIGDRVRFDGDQPHNYSSLGEGSIVGQSKDKTAWRVKWDNRKDVQVVHPRFLVSVALECNLPFTRLPTCAHDPGVADAFICAHGCNK